ncbi:MAG: polynucleotide adenylyltransferase PcnB [Methylococcaceae bacterium]|nr:polynucleotide adenylyltransferase PcnB [Methylococcaceae bacterium]
MSILTFIKKLLAPSPLVETPPALPGDGLPRVYSRSEHNISRSLVSENALKVLYRLKKAGFEAYLVGGCVRDLLLGREPKDFDVVTDAHPEQIRSVFRNCRLIGRRFRLAHVHFGQEIIEVATFRALQTEEAQTERVLENGRILRDNVYGTIEEDAFRRDFSVNALYYNINDFSVVDFVGGMEDHRACVMRLIGDPEKRYREDPVRMLRAVRFAVKLGFAIHEDSAEPIPRLAKLLREIPAARLFDEVMKLMLSGYAVQTFEQLRHYGLFAALFPETERCLGQEPEGFPLTFLAKSLERTDSRIAEHKPVAPYFLFAALLWEPVRTRAQKLIDAGQNALLAYQDAGNEVVNHQIRLIALPKSIGLPVREVWSMQPRFEMTQGGRPFRLLGHPRFRAAYDFLVLRAETGEADPALAEWWTRFQSANEAEQKSMVRSGQRSSTRTRTRKRRPRKKAPGHAPIS